MVLALRGGGLPYGGLSPGVEVRLNLGIMGLDG